MTDLTTADYYEHEVDQTSTDYYSGEYEDEMCVKTEVQKFGAIVTIVFFSVVIIFSVLGNILILIILVKYENLKSMTNAFLLNLALSDLIFTLGLPFWARYEIQDWIFGKTACKAVSFIFDVGYYSSIIFVTTMTIHRYLAVVHPMSVVISRKSFYRVVMSSVMWVASCLAATPALFFKTSYEISNDNSLYCEYESTEWKLVETYQRNVFFLISFAVIVFCYTQIFPRHLWPNSHTRHKTVRLILSIVVFFFLGWAPYNVALFLQSLVFWQLKPFGNCAVSTTVDYVFYVGRLVAFSHCCLNPIFMFKFRNLI
ncbi:C-C chemokine receptor type 4-like [Sardina pilchardus]|uniref:C-C chemokine receptor type 4-like n=1 Tax=Sardina pilchardus TaxID=27697 RepID=UPI002E10BF83